jgi:ABC-type transport system involved in cytochrome c biogenesis permease subunit
VNVVGLAVMIFNLLFVNLVSTGLHSYAGVS